MGLFSRSSSSSSTTTNVDNSNVGAAENSIALGSGASFSMVDPGALKFGEKALDLVSDTVGRAVSVTTGALDKYQAQAKDSLSSLISIAKESQKQNVQQLTETVFKWGIGGLAALAAVAGAVSVFRNRRGTN